VTSIRAWNGSAWVQPKYYWGLRDEWLQYEPGVTDYPLRYTFDTDDEEWTGGSWSPGHYVQTCSTDDTVGYAYSPYWTVHVSYGVTYSAAATVYLAAATGALPRWTANLYLSGMTGTPEIPDHYFSYVGERVTLYMPPSVADGMLLFPDAQCCLYSAAGSSATVHIEQFELYRTDGQPISNTKPARNVPYYFDGAAWRPQTEA